MHCNICDRELSDKEVVWNVDLNTYEPCTTCLDIAMDAAYSNGFKTENDEYDLFVEPEFDGQFESVQVPIDPEEQWRTV